MGQLMVEIYPKSLVTAIGKKKMKKVVTLLLVLKLEHT